MMGFSTLFIDPTTRNVFEVGCGGAGYTAAGQAWTGPRDWDKEQYGPGADCIVTWLDFLFYFC